MFLFKKLEYLFIYFFQNDIMSADEYLSNPFAALFLPGTQTAQFNGQGGGTNNEDEKMSSEKEASKNLASEKIKINSILEEIFLITLDSGQWLLS